MLFSLLSFSTLEGDIDPRRENWYTLIQSATIVLESLSLEPEIQDSGVNLIFDCTNFSLKIMKWATPHKLKVLMGFLQVCEIVLYLNKKSSFREKVNHL